MGEKSDLPDLQITYPRSRKSVLPIDSIVAKKKNKKRETLRYITLDEKNKPSPTFLPKELSLSLIKSLDPAIDLEIMTIS